jgi:O-antigen ligase
MQSATTIWVWQDWRLPLTIGVLGAFLGASLFYTPLPFLLLLGVPLCFYYFSRPYELLLLMAFLIPFNFVFKIGPVLMAVELLKVFAWIPMLIHLRATGEPFRTSRYNWWLALVAGLLLISVFRSDTLPFTIKECLRLLSNIGLCYLVLNLVDSREKVLQIFRVLTYSTFLVACYGFYQFAIQDYGGLFWLINPRLDTTVAPGRVAFWEWRNRITSVLTSELELGHYFNLCVPIGIALWLTEGRRHLSSKWLWMTLAMLVGLLLTFTFGAWFALPATWGVFFLLFDKKHRWKMTLAAALVLLVLASLLLYSPVRTTLTEKVLGNGVGGLAWDAVTRLDSWKFAITTWMSHPLVGVGYGNYQVLEYAHEYVHSEWGSGGSSPHETYLFLLASLGVVGMVSILVVALGTVRSNLRFRTHPELGLIALALAFALTANMVGWFSDDTSFLGAHANYLFWLLIGLSEAIRNFKMTGDQATSMNGRLGDMAGS